MVSGLVLAEAASIFCHERALITFEIFTVLVCLLVFLGSTKEISFIVTKCARHLLISCMGTNMRFWSHGPDLDGG